jgi:hypothetical protein
MAIRIHPATIASRKASAEVEKIADTASVHPVVAASTPCLRNWRQEKTMVHPIGIKGQNTSAVLRNICPGRTLVGEFTRWHARGRVSRVVDAALKTERQRRDQELNSGC